MPFVRSHGTEIYYESQGEGPAILLAHGGGGNAASWFAQVAHFRASQHRAIVERAARDCCQRVVETAEKGELQPSDARVLKLCSWTPRTPAESRPCDGADGFRRIRKTK